MIKPLSNVVSTSLSGILSIFCASEITCLKDSGIKNSIPGRGAGGRGGQALITLKINPSNGHDYADTRDPCLYTNTPTNLRGSGAWMPAKPAMIQEMFSSCRAAAITSYGTVMHICVRCHGIDLRSKGRLLKSLGNAPLTFPDVYHTLLLLSVHLETVRDSPSQQKDGELNKIPWRRNTNLNKTDQTKAKKDSAD